MFSIPPGAINITAKPTLGWKDRIAQFLLEIKESGPIGDHLRPILISVVVTSIIATTVHVVIPALEALVIACCSGLIFLACRAVIAENVACKRLVHEINRRKNQIVDEQPSSLSEVLRGIERECIGESSQRLSTFNYQLADFIAAIEPTLVTSSPYRSLNPGKYLQARVAYSSRLFVDSDTIVRLSLFLTFATLTLALYKAAIDLPQVGTHVQDSAANIDLPKLGNQVQDNAARANMLVRNLITAASLKFTVSAVGLGLSIVLRFWARVQESRISGIINSFSRDVFKAVDAFLQQRARGTLRSSGSDSRSLSDLLGELIEVTRGNTEVHREISNAVFVLGRRS